MDTKTVNDKTQNVDDKTQTDEDKTRTLIDDIGTEDCEVVSVNLKRKRRLKSESSEDGQAKRTKPESNDCLPVEVDGSITTTKCEDLKTEALKPDGSVSISEDIRTEVKCCDTKSKIKSLDHKFSYQASSAEFESGSIKIGSFGYSKTESVSSYIIKCEYVESSECNSIVVNSESVCPITSDRIAHVDPPDSIAHVDIPDSVASVNITPCPAVSDLGSDAPILDYKFTVTGFKKEPVEKSNSTNSEMNFPHMEPKVLSVAPILEVDRVENSPAICEMSTGTPTVSSMTEPTVSSMAEPAVSSMAEPTVSSMAEPAVSSMAEPTVSSMAEPTVSSMTDPTVSSTTVPSPAVKCNFCRMTFTNKQECDEHNTTHLSCNECGKQFKKHIYLSRHQKTQHGIVAAHFCCKCCGKELHSRAGLAAHRRYCQRGIFICTLCSETFKERLLIEDHLHTAHKLMTKESMAQFFLHVLDKNIPESARRPSSNETPTDQELHDLSVVSSDQLSTKSSFESSLHLDCGELFTCLLCDQAFQHKGNLMKHQIIHIERKRQACLICEQTFDELKSFKTHMASHRGSDQCLLPEELRRGIKISPRHMSAMYVCCLCGVKYRYLKSATQHLQQHKDSVCYTCNFCWKEQLIRGNCKGPCVIPGLGTSHNGKVPRKSTAASIPGVTPVLDVPRLRSGSDKNAVYDDSVDPQKVNKNEDSNTPHKSLCELYNCGSCGGMFETLQEFASHENRPNFSLCKRSSRRICKVVMSVDASHVIRYTSGSWLDDN